MFFPDNECKRAVQKRAIFGVALYI